MDMNAALPPGSRAWCGDCSWQYWGTQAHTTANAHAHTNEHVVHLWEPDEPVCGDIHVPLYGDPISCTRPADHDGRHSADRLDRSATVGWPRNPQPVHDGVEKQ